MRRGAKERMVVEEVLGGEAAMLETLGSTGYD
jgi:hypothetical protein